MEVLGEKVSADVLAPWGRARAREVRDKTPRRCAFLVKAKNGKARILLLPKREVCENGNIGNRLPKGRCNSVEDNGRRALILEAGMFRVGSDATMTNG